VTEEQRLKKLEYNKAWKKKHRAKVSAKEKQWRERKLQIDPDYYRRLKYIETYGISLDEKACLFEQQGSSCAICKTQDSKQWHTDHDHYVELTQRRVVVRGILCSSCNLLLGHAKDNENILLAAIHYLKLNKENHNG
jgi:hypothetical protein